MKMQNVFITMFLSVTLTCKHHSFNIASLAPLPNLEGLWYTEMKLFWEL